MNTNFSPILFVLAIRVQFGRLPGYIHCSYKLVLLENSLKLNCLFCRKEYPFQEPKAIFFVYYSSYDLQTYIKQGASNVTIRKKYLYSYIVYRSVSSELNQ